MRLYSRFAIAFLSLGMATACAHTPSKASAAAAAPAYQIQTRQVSYSFHGTKMIGYLAVPVTKEKRPGILIVHEWWGLNEYPKHRAEMLAHEGYVALAVDMYGNGKVATTPKEAQALDEATLKHIKNTEGRFRAALKTLKNMSEVDPAHIAAMGYCYGGGLVLEMARRGVPLNMVFSYHGTLSSVGHFRKGRVKAHVFVFTGQDDPFVPQKVVKKFEHKMKWAKVDYQLFTYPHAIHAFTNPESTALGQKYHIPIAYNQSADLDSWSKTLAALKTL